MKVLVLNGSPKKDNSDTMHMTRAFLEGMDAVHVNEVTVLHAVDQVVKPCLGCFVCKKNGGICMLEDDMADILRQILASDLLIWSFPLYCFGMPAPLKAIIDRTMPLSTMAMHKVDGRYEHESQRDFSRLKYVMISGCGFPSAQNNFEGMITQFQYMFGVEDSTIITVTESPIFGVHAANAVTKPFLQKVRKAGREYAETGVLSEHTLRKLSRPMIPPKLYERIANGQ